nr:substrate-binding domain-containing protein [Collinsella urealyticum]
MRKKRSNVVGVVVPNISNEYFSSMILAMQQVFFENDYSITIFNTNNSVEMERACHAQLSALSVAGVISANSREDVRDALKRVVPTIYVDRFVDTGVGGKVACISSDNHRGGMLAAQELWESGSRNPVVITASAESPVTQARTDGFLAGLRSLGLELDPDRIISPVKSSIDAGKEIVSSLIANGVEFDGLFCETDRLAVGALETLSARYMLVPDEVAVVGYDDITLARFARPPLTTVHQDSHKIGERAALLMLEMVRGAEPKEAHITLPVGLVRRETTRRE